MKNNTTETTLHLSLKKAPFDVMVTGEKMCEYRKPSEWIEKRLFYNNGCHKQYAFVKFVNGYGADKPYFICRFEHFSQQHKSRKRPVVFSNGLSVMIEKEDYIIQLGEIVERGNLRS